MAALRPRWIVRFLAVLLATLSAACGRTEGGSRPQTLTLAEQAEPISLNPLLLEGTTSGMIGSILYSFLVTIDPAGNLIPDAAAVVPTRANGGISRDGLTVTYHLRRGMRWHDGAPLTARDCVFTFGAIMNPRNNIPDRHGYDQIAAVTAPNDTTVVVRLKHPYSPIVDTFLALNANYPIVPAHLMQGLPDVNNLDTRRYTVGTGPYRLVEWKRGDHITFAAFDGYVRGRPRIGRIELRFIPNAATMLNQLRTGELDGALSITDPGLLPQLQPIAGIRISTEPTYGALSLHINTQSPITSDVRVRRAVLQAVDWDAVADRPSHGLYRERGAMRGLFGAFDAGPQLLPYDPAAARAGLDAAGWSAGRDGIRTKNGRPLTLVMVYSSALPIVASVGTQMQQALRTVGIDLVLHAYAPSQFMSPAAQGGPAFGGHFDLLLLNEYATAGADSSSFFICSERAPNGFNLERLCDGRIDALSNDALTHYDVARQRRDVAEMERLIVEDATYRALGEIRFISATTTRLRGLTASPVSPYVGMWNWTLAPR